MMETENKNNDGSAGSYATMVAIIIVCSFLMCVLFGSCKTRYITTTTEVPVVQTHTINNERTKIVRDTIFTHDSVFTYIKGDTLLERHYNTIYKYSTRFDTIMRVDSIPFSVVTKQTEIKEVEKQLSTGQKLMMDLGEVFIALISLAILVVIGLLIWKKIKG